jgi:hypothetical protein
VLFVCGPFVWPPAYLTSQMTIPFSYHHGVTGEVAPLSFGQFARGILKDVHTPAYLQFLQQVFGVYKFLPSKLTALSIYRASQESRILRKVSTTLVVLLRMRQLQVLPILWSHHCQILEVPGVPLHLPCFPRLFTHHTMQWDPAFPRQIGGNQQQL